MRRGSTQLEFCTGGVFTAARCVFNLSRRGGGGGGGGDRLLRRLLRFLPGSLFVEWCFVNFCDDFLSTICAGSNNFSSTALFRCSLRGGRNVAEGEDRMIRKYEIYEEGKNKKSKVPAFENILYRPLRGVFHLIKRSNVQ
uniref:Uncharacterized protein n=1 Tax=Romanomermis culicivorax TaxID=13658 RepID=A0A915JNV8_ROMCU